MYYQAIEIPKYSNIICAMRSILILPIVLYKVFGVNGIWISMAVSELLIILIVYKSFKINKCTQRALSEVII